MDKYGVVFVVRWYQIYFNCIIFLSIIDYAPKNYNHTFALDISNLPVMKLKVVDLIWKDYVQCGLCIVSEHLIYVQFGNGTHWFGANAWLHPTAAQSAAAFLHLPVEDEIWVRNGGGQRSDGNCDLVPWANKFFTIASMHCKLLM